MKRIAIIDGNSLINRAYYAMRNPMITKEGIFTHGIFGFINMLEKIKKDYAPEYLAVAFDLKAPTFRHKEYDQYKAGRKKMPPELAMQLPLLKDVLSAMNIKQLSMEGFEADDIIGTLAKRAEDAGLEPYIITGDRDELQLASKVTRVIITKKGVSEFECYDEAAMIEKYGFTPQQFIDYKGLMGDQSDNIPGLPGVGEKTASKLILEYGSVENLIANVDSVKPKGLQTKIQENVQLAVMSKRLATINTCVPIDVELEECRITEVDYHRLVEIYSRLEFNKFLKNLKAEPEEQMSLLSPAGDSTMETGHIDTDRYSQRNIMEESDLSELSLQGEVIIKVYGDNNHLNSPKISSISIIDEDKYYRFDLKDWENFTSWLSRQKVTFTGHNLKEDFYMLMCCGMEEPEAEYDTAIAQYVIDSGRSNYSLEALSNEYLHISLEDTEENALIHCAAVGELKAKQVEIIREQELERVLYQIELPLIVVMASMEYEGFTADSGVLQEFGNDITGKIEQLKSEIYDIAGEEFNINSPAQLGVILFEKLQLPVVKKTKRGYSTGAEVLEKLRDKSPIIDAVLEYRTLSKLKSTYVDGLIPLISSSDNKIRAHFNQTVTTTGRISCTEPNLQNIPIRQELGRQLRKAFIPYNDKCILVGADYSQIELRVLAHMSQDQVLIDAFNNGEDIHRATAANVLGIKEGDITPEQRSRAKAVNFGVIYGMSAFGLSSELNITRRDAEEYIEAYFMKHNAVKEFMDRQVKFCKANGYVETMMGRKRYIKEIYAPQYMVKQAGERLAMNTPIQGSAADIIKIAMVKVYNAIKEKELKSRLILQVHDELIINTFKDEADIIEELLVKNMEEACSMAVKLKADLNYGDSWYQLK